MKRKDYQKPTTTIVRLQQQSSILAGSPEPPEKQGDLENYEVQSERFW
jgi:hypothetical protein